MEHCAFPTYSTDAVPFLHILPVPEIPVQLSVNKFWWRQKFWYNFWWTGFGDARNSGTTFGDQVLATPEVPVQHLVSLHILLNNRATVSAWSTAPFLHILPTLCLSYIFYQHQKFWYNFWWTGFGDARNSGTTFGEQVLVTAEILAQLLVIKFWRHQKFRCNTWLVYIFY